MGPEAKVIAATLRWTKAHGIRHIRLSVRRGVSQGWPDHLFLIAGGRPLFIEFKAGKNKLSVLQDLKITQLKELGYDVQVCWSADDACATIARAVAAARIPASG